MSELALQAEHQKLARLLGCEESRVAALGNLGVAELRQLRAACTAMLFDRDAGAFQKVVSAARLMPAPLNALIAEKAMGPVLGSKVAGLLPRKDAVEIARRVSLAFNAEVTRLLDPRRAAPMLRLVPLDIVVGVSRILVRQREYITMARFVDTLTDEQIRAVMEILDDESMLRIGFFVESPQRLEEVVGLMSRQRLQQVMAAAARPELDLSGPALMLLAGVSEGLRARMVEAALLHADAEVGNRLGRAIQRHRLQTTFASLPDKIACAAGERLREWL